VTASACCLPCAPYRPATQKLTQLANVTLLRCEHCRVHHLRSRFRRCHNFAFFIRLLGGSECCRDFSTIIAAAQHLKHNVDQPTMTATYFILESPRSERLLAEAPDEQHEIVHCPNGHLKVYRRVGDLRLHVKHNQNDEKIVWK